MLLTLLISGCVPAVSVKMGSETYMMRENKVGIPIVPMEDVIVKAFQKQDDGQFKLVNVLIKQHTVIRVGIEFICRDDQISIQEQKKFKAMVPGKNSEELVLSDFTIDKGTGIKYGTTMWEQPVENKDIKLPVGTTGQLKNN